MWTQDVISIGLFFLIGWTAPSTAQDLAGLPTCGQNCLLSAFTAANGGCTQTDFACLCKSSSFLNASTACYATACSASDLTASTTWGLKTCASVGVNATAAAANVTSTGSVIGNGTVTTNGNNSTRINGTTASANARNSGSSPSMIHLDTLTSFSVISVILISSIIMIS